MTSPCWNWHGRQVLMVRKFSLILLLLNFLLEFVEPIRVPSRAQEKNTFNNVNSWAAGWGYDGDSSVYPVDKLRETGIHVILNFK